LSITDYKISSLLIGSATFCTQGSERRSDKALTSVASNGLIPVNALCNHNQQHKRISQGSRLTVFMRKCNASSQNGTTSNFPFRVSFGAGDADVMVSKCEAEM